MNSSDIAKSLNVKTLSTNDMAKLAGMQPDLNLQQIQESALDSLLGYAKNLGGFIDKAERDSGYLNMMGKVVGHEVKPQLKQTFDELQKQNNYHPAYNADKIEKQTSSAGVNFQNGNIREGISDTVDAFKALGITGAFDAMINSLPRSAISMNPVGFATNVAAYADQYAEQRAEANGNSNYSFNDIWKQIPSATASTALDRLGLEGEISIVQKVQSRGLANLLLRPIETLSNVVKSGIIEAGTEMSQQAIEEYSSLYGTKNESKLTPEYLYGKIGQAGVIAAGAGGATHVTLHSTPVVSNMAKDIKDTVTTTPKDLQPDSPLIDKEINIADLTEPYKEPRQQYYKKSNGEYVPVSFDENNNPFYTEVKSNEDGDVETRNIQLLKDSPMYIKDEQIKQPESSMIRQFIAKNEDVAKASTIDELEAIRQGMLENKGIATKADEVNEVFSELKKQKEIESTSTELFKDSKSESKVPTWLIKKWENLGIVDKSLGQNRFSIQEVHQNILKEAKFEITKGKNAFLHFIDRVSDNRYKSFKLDDPAMQQELDTAMKNERDYFFSLYSQHYGKNVATNDFVNITDILSNDKKSVNTKTPIQPVEANNGISEPINSNVAYIAQAKPDANVTPLIKEGVLEPKETKFSEENLDKLKDTDKISKLASVIQSIKPMVIVGKLAEKIKGTEAIKNVLNVDKNLANIDGNTAKAIATASLATVSDYIDTAHRIEPSDYSKEVQTEIKNGFIPAGNIREKIFSKAMDLMSTKLSKSMKHSDAKNLETYIGNIGIKGLEELYGDKFESKMVTIPATKTSPESKVFMIKPHGSLANKISKELYDIDESSTFQREPRLGGKASSVTFPKATATQMKAFAKSIQKQAMTILASQKWYINHELLNEIKANREFFLDMFKDNIDLATRTLDNIIEFADKAKDSSFTFPYFFTGQRLMNGATIMNPESDKMFARWLLHDGKQSVTNSGSINQIRAILLAYGHKIETMSDNMAQDKFKDIVKEIANRGDAYENKASNYKEGFHTYLAERSILNALKNHSVGEILNGEAIMDIVPIETDGITNGVAIGTMQAAAYYASNRFYSLANKFGLYLSEDASFDVFKQKGKDLYESLWDMTSKQLDKRLNDIVKDDGRKKDAGRKLAKSPVMIYSYVAGKKKVLDTITDYLDDTYGKKLSDNDKVSIAETLYANLETQFSEQREWVKQIGDMVEKIFNEIEDKPEMKELKARLYSKDITREEFNSLYNEYMDKHATINISGFPVKLFKEDKTRDYSSMATIAFKKGESSAHTMSYTPTDKAIADRKATAVVILIHHLDGLVMSKAIMAKKYKGNLNQIYDAIVNKPMDSDEFSQAYNKAFIETMKEVDLLGILADRTNTDVSSMVEKKNQLLSKFKAVTQMAGASNGVYRFDDKKVTYDDFIKNILDEYTNYQTDKSFTRPRITKSMFERLSTGKKLTSAQFKLWQKIVFESGIDLKHSDVILKSEGKDFHPDSMLDEMNLVHDANALLNAYDVISIIDSGIITDSHDTYLRGLIESISDKLGKPMKRVVEKIKLYSGDETLGKYNVTRGDVELIIGKTTPIGEMSAREAYAHELVHKAGEYALKEDFVLRNQLVKHMEYAKANLKSTISKARLDYIFSSPSEFLAYYETNEEFRRAVEALPPMKVTGTMNKLVDMVHRIFDVISRALNRDGVKPTSYRNLNDLVKDIYALNKRYEKGAVEYSSQFSDMLSGKDAKYASIIQKHTARAINWVKTGTPSKVGKSLMKSRLYTKYLQNGLFKALYNEFMTPIESVEGFREASRIKTNMENNYINLRDGMTRNLKETLDTTPEVESSITSVLIDTDATSLLNSGYSMKDIREFISDESKLDTEIDKFNTDISNTFIRAKAQNLAYFMVTGESHDAFMALNPEMIIKQAKVRNTNVLKSKIDTLVSLYAIKFADAKDKTNVSSYTNDEALLNCMKLMNQSNKQSMAELFNKYGESHFAIKGYSKEVFNSNKQMLVAPLRHTEDLLKAGYKLAYKLEMNKSPIDTKFTQEQNGVFLIENYQPKYQEGAMDIVAMKSKGTDMDSLEYMYATGIVTGTKTVYNEDFINSKQKFSSTYDVRGSEEQHIIPVFDSNRKLVGFRYVMSKANKINLMKLETRASNVIGEYNGFVQRKIDAMNLNKSISKIIVNDYLKNYKSKPEEFVVMNKDNKYGDIYGTIPTKIRMDLKSMFAADGINGIAIRKDLIDNLIGYKDVSITGMKWLNKLPYLKKSLMKYEALHKDLISHYKQSIIVRTPDVIKRNIISNFAYLTSIGVAPDYNLKYSAEAIKATNAYQKYHRELIVLKQKEKSGVPVNQSRIKFLQNELKNNPVAFLIEHGQFQAIVEELETDIVQNKNRIEAGLTAVMDKYVGKDNKVRSMLDNAYINENTELYSVLMKTVQYSDFVARYVAFKHMTEVQGIGRDVALDTVESSFINYNINQNKYVKYLSDISIFMFTKYYARIQKWITALYMKHPSKVASLQAAQMAFGNISDISDSSLITNPRLPFHAKPSDLLMEVTPHHLLEALL